MVHFVGAGSGATDLITVRGKGLLEQADVVIYAGSLVNPALLGFCREDAKIFNSAEMHLDEVLDVMKANRDAEVVRLHTGDPSIYGAIREQMDALDELGIAYDVTPGVSSFFAAAASVGCEYTLPGISQTVIITRMEGRTPVPEGQQLAKLAAALSEEAPRQ
jgi:precorrin-4/cobalt-precorrin-4 C11-methyltransferase